MTDNDSDDITQDYPKPLPLEQLAPPGDRFSHEQALHFSSVAVQPELYDPDRSATIKLAAAYLELTRLLNTLRDVAAVLEESDRLKSAVQRAEEWASELHRLGPSGIAMAAELRQLIRGGR